MTFESTEIATAHVLEHLGLGPEVLREKGLSGSDLEVRSPIDGAVIGSFASNGPERIDEILEQRRPLSGSGARSPLHTGGSS